MGSKVDKLIAEGLQFHREGLMDDGEVAGNFIFLLQDMVSKRILMLFLFGPKKKCANK